MQLIAVAPRADPRSSVSPYVTAFHVVRQLQDVREAVEGRSQLGRVRSKSHRVVSPLIFLQ